MMSNVKKKMALAAAGSAMALAFASPVHAVPVALELALVIDVSGSVDATEYVTQRDGYETAFHSAAVKQGIESFAASGGVAASVFFFSSNVLQMISWTQLTSQADSDAFANQIGLLVRPSEAAVALGGGALGATTNVAEGIDQASLSIAVNSFEGTRRVIDVSGDGVQNISRDGNAGCVEPVCTNLLDDASDDAFAAGITVNGLAITNDVPTLAVYFATNVITPGGFALAATFDTFASTLETKIGREISGAPEPGSLALAGLALAALAGMRRRKRAPSAKR